INKALEDKFPKMGVATVYNNLWVFREIGLLRELPYNDDARHYNCNKSEHNHVIWDVSRKIDDFDDPLLDEEESVAEQMTGFKINRHRMELYGTCESCQQVGSQSN